MDSVGVSLGWDEVDAYLGHMAPSFMRQQTCGYLVRETDEALLITLSRSEHDEPEGYGHINNAVLIPKSAVVSVVRLTPKKTKAKRGGG